MEIWKPVQNYEGLYEISNLGNVRRTARGKKFTGEQITEAKKMLSDGLTLKTVADFLSTSITTVMSIKQGKTWCGNEKFRPVKLRADKHFYLMFTPSKDGKYGNKPVHRAVWEAFNGPIEGRYEVNHINLDRQDNRLENLELLTHQQNCQHAQTIYRKEYVEKFGAPKNTEGSYRGRYFK